MVSTVYPEFSSQSKASDHLSRMVPGEAKTVRREVASILKAVVPNLVSLAFTTDLWTSLRFLHQLDAHIHHKDWLLHNGVPFVRLVGFGSLSEKEWDYVGKIPKLGGGV